MGSTVKMRGSGKLNGAAFVTSSVTNAVSGNFPLGAYFFCMLPRCPGLIARGCQPLFPRLQHERIYTENLV